MHTLNQAKLQKKQAREQAMTGWNRSPKRMNRERMLESRGHQRWTSLGIGHHFARMMKGHI